MNTRTTLTFGAAAVAVVAGLAIATPVAQAVLPTGATDAATTDTAAGALSTDQLVAMYEEERLAGDVYDVFAEQYGVRIFTMIGDAEEHHRAAVAALLESSGYDVTSLPSDAGDYRTDGYEKTYADHVAAGRSSVEEAYRVGVTIEENDIADLESLLAATTDEDQTRVLTALQSGSEHHLAAFTTAVDGTTSGPGMARSQVQGGMGTGAGRHGDGACDGTARDGAGDRYGTDDRHGRGHAQAG